MRPLLLATALAAALTSTLVVVPANGATTDRPIAYRQWATKSDFTTGTLAGVRVFNGKLRLDRPVGTQRYVDPVDHRARRYDYGRWTSPWTHSAFGLTELVPSWEASTPDGSWVQVEVRGIDESGRRSSWDTLARWSAGDTAFHRTSPGAQGDDLARVATDTWESGSGGFVSWQLRVTLNRPAGTSATPRVDAVSAMTSALPSRRTVRVSRPGVARGITLDVPRFSQMTHAGQYPKYGGGGESWCSPTSTTMVLGYYGRLPAPADYAWVSRRYGDRVVDHSARMTYDYGYHGTGNWPFNTAYAATRTGHAFVTRLRSLVGAERFVKAGIPLAASITFDRGELSGAPISATNGHLVVIVGFTRAGNVVVNDPAASSDRTVRRTYDRAQFENAWLKRYPSGGSMRGSGGLVYVIRDDAHPLPTPPAHPNW